MMKQKDWINKVPYCFWLFYIIVRMKVNYPWQFCLVAHTKAFKQNFVYLEPMLIRKCIVFEMGVERISTFYIILITLTYCISPKFCLTNGPEIDVLNIFTSIFAFNRSVYKFLGWENQSSFSEGSHCRSFPLEIVHRHEFKVNWTELK